MTDLVDPESGHSGTARLEAFSDGVFAIAITLLILEVKVPHLPEEGGGRSLLSALAALWPSYLAYLTSFVTIFIMWANHHAMFTYIRRCDILQSLPPKPTFFARAPPEALSPSVRRPCGGCGVCRVFGCGGLAPRR